jgi:UDP-N-acetyl-2-amino-2-deoxyglucuronate dehydrogenase
MQKLKFGLIGAGNSARNIAVSLNTLPDAEWIGVTSAVYAESQKFAEQFQIPHVYQTHKDLISNPDIECVIISVPHNLHYPITMDALNAGKHVLCEKPLAINMEQGREMIALAKKKDLRLGTFFQNRFLDASQKAKQILAENGIGRLLHAQVQVLWTRDQEYYNSSPWRGKWATEGGGSLINQASHYIDLMIWLCGVPKTVFGVFDAKTHQIEVDDNAVALITFENGIYATIQTSTSLKPGYPAKVAIFGTEGSITLDGNFLRVVRPDGKEEVFDFDRQQVGSANDPKKFSPIAHQRLLTNYIQAVKSHKPPAVDGLEGLRAIEVITAIYKSKGQHVIIL